MAEADFYGAYVRSRLEAWGREFAYHRDREVSGYRSKDMLQVLIEHKGEMPPKVVGFKPFEVDAQAMEIEDLVRGLFHEERALAWALRAYFCGSGRRKVERFEFYVALTGRKVSVRTFLGNVESGIGVVRRRLEKLDRAA